MTSLPLSQVLLALALVLVPVLVLAYIHLSSLRFDSVIKISRISGWRVCVCFCAWLLCFVFVCLLWGYFYF